MEIALIALSATFGGIAVALLGWLDSHEPFDSRKFGASIIRSLVAGIIFAISYEFRETVSIVDFFLAFLGGAGVDALGKRISASAGNAKFPL